MRSVLNEEGIDYIFALRNMDSKSPLQFFCLGLSLKYQFEDNVAEYEQRICFKPSFNQLILIDFFPLKHAVTVLGKSIMTMSLRPQAWCYLFMETKKLLFYGLTTWVLILKLTILQTKVITLTAKLTLLTFHRPSFYHKKSSYHRETDCTIAVKLVKH